MVGRFTIEATCVPENTKRITNLILRLAREHDCELTSFAIDPRGNVTAIFAVLEGEAVDLMRLNQEWTQSIRVA